MLAEQIPGTLFVLLVALAAFMNQDPDVILILAAGCAAGWASYTALIPWVFWVVSLGLWAWAFILLATRILL